MAQEGLGLRKSRHAESPSRSSTCLDGSGQSLISVRGTDWGVMKYSGPGDSDRESRPSDREATVTVCHHCPLM